MNAPEPLAPDLAAPPQTPAVQSIVKVRRDYNSWVARETMEDYALRYTPQRFRKWSEWRVANTAFGAASFLIRGPWLLYLVYGLAFVLLSALGAFIRLRTVSNAG